MHQKVKGDWYIKLAHQFIAAVLNTSNGAHGLNIVECVADSFDMLSEDCENLSDLERAKYCHDLFDEFNNGNVGPPHCDETRVYQYCHGECLCPVQPTKKRENSEIYSTPQVYLEKAEIMKFKLARTNVEDYFINVNSEIGNCRETGRNEEDNYIEVFIEGVADKNVCSLIVSGYEIYYTDEDSNNSTCIDY
jgi:hypothetical protein